MIILDTSILIDYIRQPNSKRNTLFDKITRTEGSFSLGISTVTIQELYQGKSTRIKAKEEEMLDVLGLLRIYVFDEGVATIAGKIIRDWKPNLGFADAAIAATAINEECRLFTLNYRDFSNIPDLSLYFLR